MLDKVIKFLRDFDQDEYCSRVGIIKLTYIYYKNDSLYTQIKEKFQKRGQSVDPNTYIVENSQETIHDLVQMIQKYATTTKHRNKATLYQIYHHALHNRLREAKQIMMSSHMN
jgi:hypothetical protein